MTTDFETELKGTLHDIAEEAGPISPSAASDALGIGRKIQYRRQGMVVIAVTAVLVVVAASTAWATTAHRQSAPAAKPGSRTGVTLTVSDRTDGVTVSSVQHTLTDRLGRAGIKVLSVKPIGPARLHLVLKGKVSAATLTPLIASNNFEIRAVLKSTEDIGSRTAPPANATDRNPTLAEVKAKLGSAYAIGAAILDPATVTQAQATELAPFATLTPAEVGVLPPTMQYAVPLISCAQLNARSDAVVAGVQARSQVTACGRDGGSGQVKFLLDSAAVVGLGGTNKASATHEGDLGWVVNLTFNATNQMAWTQLTSDLYDEYLSSGIPTYRQAAFMLDTNVLSAPNIEAAIPGPATISSKFTQKTAKATALAIGGGPLHATVSIDSIARTTS